jgi:hypothetical protein
VVPYEAGRAVAVVGEISRRIPEAYEWDYVADPAPRGYNPPVERSAIEVPVKVLSEYVGVYALNPEVSVTITLEDRALYAQPTGQERVAVIPDADEPFFLLTVNA